MKKVWILVLALLLLVPTTQAFAASEPAKVKAKSMMHFVVDGKEYAPPTEQVGGFIFVKDGEGFTYVPLRFVAYILKKDVSWDNKAKKVTVSDPDEAALVRIEAFLSQQLVENSVIEPLQQVTEETINIELLGVTYVFNGEQVEPDTKTPGLLINNSLYVPLRFMYKSLGYEAIWDGKTYTVSVDTVYWDIVNAYDVQIRAFQDQVINEARQLVVDMGYTVTDVLGKKLSEDQKAELWAAGEPLIAEKEAEMTAMLEELVQELEARGYSTEILEQYYKQMENLKKLAKSILGV